MSMIPMRPLGFGEIVDGALQLYRRDFGLYYLIALVAAFPGYVLMLVSGVDLASIAPTPGADPAEAFAAMGPVFAVTMAAAAMAWVGWIAVGVAMVERIGERPASLGHSYRGAFRHLPSTAGATVVALLAFALIFFAVFSLAGIVLAAFLQTGSVALVLITTVVLILVLAVVVAFWMGATFGILPAVIIEGRGAMSALGRSLRLCRGGWLRVTGIMVVAMIINLVPTIGVTALFGMGDLFVSPDAVGEVSSNEQWLLNTVDLVIGPLTTPFLVGSIMVLFHDRRVRSEAFDLETLAGAMDRR